MFVLLILIVQCLASVVSNKYCTAVSGFAARADHTGLLEILVAPFESSPVEYALLIFSLIRARRWRSSIWHVAENIGFTFFFALTE